MSDGLKMKLDYDNYVSTLADLNKYYTDVGFVGDEKTRLALAIAVLRRKCLGIVSGSGSGKTAVVDALLTLFKPHQIYKMGAGSEKAEAYSAAQINNADILYLTEIQKAANGEIVIELLKDLGEGKDYVRKVTQSDKSVEPQTIKKGKAVIYTKAIENKFESDDELDRRFPKLVTDMTKAQNGRVVEAKAAKRANPTKPHTLNDVETNSLRYHMSKSLKEDAGKFVFVNPMAEYLATFIPTTFALSRSYVDHYMDLAEGVTFFNRRNRMSKDITINGKLERVLFVTPEDCWQLHQIYNQQFLQDVLNIPPNGNFIFDVFREARKKGVKSNAKKGIFNQDTTEETKVKLTPEQIFLLLKDMGLVVKETIIHKILTDLMMSGYVREEVTMMGSKKVVEYYLSDELTKFENNIPWDKVNEYAKASITKYFPENAPEYIEKYCTNPKFINPFNGETFVLQENPQPKVKIDDRDEWLETEQI